MQKNKSLNKNQILDFLLDKGIIVSLFVLIVLISILSSNFLTTRNLINLLRQISINGVISIGMTMVILTGGIDLSVGSMLAFGGVVAAGFISPQFGSGSSGIFISLLLGLIAGASLGAFNGLIISKFKVPPFVMTLGMLSIARGFTYIYSDGMPIPDLGNKFLFMGHGEILGLPFPVLVYAIIFGISWFLLYKTRYGRYIYAVGGNEESARISGINVKKIKFSVYTYSGLMCAIAGILLSARTTAGLPQAGQGYELNAIGAVVIGGTSLKGGRGSLIGTLIGVLIIGIISNGLDLLGVSSYYQQLVKGAIIVLAVLMNHLKYQSN